jgi:hypothetical protein
VWCKFDSQDIHNKLYHLTTPPPPLPKKSCKILWNEQGWFFQLFNWFQLFSSENCFLKCAGQDKPEQVKNGYRCFHLFSIDFQLFYFLTKIIPERVVMLFVFLCRLQSMNYILI